MCRATSGSCATCWPAPRGWIWRCWSWPPTIRSSPRLREHLEILRLLNLDTGVIAITKADLAEPDWLDLVEEEVRTLTAGTFLADAPLVRTSVTTGLGLEALREALATAAARAAQSQRMAMIRAPFRMAIDRSFTIAGHGRWSRAASAAAACDGATN